MGKKGKRKPKGTPAVAPEKVEASWKNYLDGLVATVLDWMSEIGVEIDGEEKVALERRVGGLPIPIETADGIQLQFPGTVMNREGPDLPPADISKIDPALILEAKKRREELEVEAAIRARPYLVILNQGLALDRRDVKVEAVESRTEYSEKKGSYEALTLRLATGQGVPLGPAEDAIAQSKVRAALARWVHHVLPKLGEGEWTRTAQAILDAQEACRLRWGKERHLEAYADLEVPKEVENTETQQEPESTVAKTEAS